MKATHRIYFNGVLEVGEELCGFSKEEVEWIISDLTKECHVHSNDIGDSISDIPCRINVTKITKVPKSEELIYVAEDRGDE